LSFETDGWYVDLLYGIECSPDLSGSIPHTQSFPSDEDECFFHYLIKSRYWTERKRSGPWPLGFPLLETTTTYDNKGKARVMTDEVLELSTAELDAALFDAPAGFARVEFKSHGASLFDKILSRIGKR